MRLTYAYVIAESSRNKHNGLVDFFDQSDWSHIKLRLMDIGSRGGLPPEWLSYKKLLEVIGFEPNKIECDRLNGETAENETFKPYCIGDGNQGIFFHANFPASSGLRRNDNGYLQRLHNTHRENLRTIQEKVTETVRLDDLLSQGKILQPDFLKIDTEGTEADCLENGTLCLSNGLMGLSVEIWLSPIKGVADSFCRIDTLCREYGLHLFEISTAHSRVPRAALPKRLNFNKLGIATVNENFGQRIAIDCLYLRDPIYEFRASDSRSSFQWTDEKIVKMCLIYEVYGLHDCAIELLDFYQQEFQTSLPTGKIKNLLIPSESNPRGLSYQEYFDVTARFDYIEDVYRPHRRR